MYKWILFLMLTYNISAQSVTTISSNSGVTDALVFDQNNNLTGSDYYNGNIFTIDLNSGSASLFAEGFASCNGLVYDSNHILYMADNLGNKIYKVHPDGEKELFVNFINPSSLIFEHDSDTLIAASYLQKKIVKIAPDGTIVNWSTGGQLSGGPNGFIFDDENNLYVCNFDNRKIIQIHTDGSQSLLIQAPGSGAMGGITYHSGYIYASLIHNHRIFRTDLEGNGAIFMGSTKGTVDGDHALAKFDGPNGILASITGDTLYVSDLNTSNIRMITGVNQSVHNTDLTIRKTEISIQPNPSIDQFVFSINISQNSTISASIYDIFGNQIKSILNKQKLPLGHHTFSVNTDTISNGIYFIRLHNEQGQTIIRKLSIQR